ncbi:hypothetical protein ACM46_22075 [Chryseobacterium angstadtii]|uniref:Uncharacterized protein n=1 Tax=Chryseobacterium angstadtii TaxID=558151 RepID=A0A0J7HYD9_9FLAO|nr:hypothetical protein [Chryseobacterium angstadtii]KMQ58709.1 hypothetical protein ACM46_22075 [Chryseobacterium angstadtii]
MKKISVLAAIFLATAVFGQKISDYKYILVPETFNDFVKNSYEMDRSLIKALKSKGYTVFQEGKDPWPSEVDQRSCGYIVANILNKSSFLRNKVELEFRDCNKKVIFSSTGNSNLKEYKEGYQDALKLSLASVPVSKPVENLQVTKAESPNVQPVKKTEEPLAEPVSENKSGKYSNGKLNLQKIQVDAGQFILADSGSSVPFAVFKTSSKKDVFRVKLADGSYTIGYFEHGNIVIDMPQSNGDLTKEVFSSK